MVASFVLLLAACATDSPEDANQRIGYLGNNVFTWGGFGDLLLVSGSRTGAQPTIRSGGAFLQDEAILFLVEGGRRLPHAYVSLAGDQLAVDFSAFAEEGRLFILREHMGLVYVGEELVATERGLVSDVFHPQEIPEAPVEDIETQGRLYFSQAPGADLDEAKRRFFAAGASHPRVGAGFLRDLQNEAERRQDPVLALEIVNYRDRFELLEELELAGSESGRPPGPAG